MNTTQDWKLSYTKVYPIRRTYRNSVFFGNSRKLLITSPSTLTNEEYHNQFKPTLNLLRLLGMLPLKMSSHGGPEFKFFSPVMAYSACVYLVKVFTMYRILRNVALPRIARQEDFVSTVLTWLAICSALLFTVSPILMWLDSHKVSLHIEKWLQFQKISELSNLGAIPNYYAQPPVYDLYRKVTGQHLIFAVRKRGVWSAVFTIVLGTTLTFCTLVAPITERWLIPFPFFITTTVGCFGIYRGLSYSTLTIAGQKLILLLKKDLKKRNVSPYLIGKYRVLWLQLSQLASQTGDVMGKATVFYLVSYLFALTASLYGCLAGFLTKGHSSMESALSGLGFAICALSLYSVCIRAHEVTHTIETRVLEELQFIASFYLQPEINVQVRKFLQTMSMNRPVISALGFVTINKGLVKSFASTLVTYMIFLLQFSMGEHKTNNDCDVPRNTTGTF